MTDCAESSEQHKQDKLDAEDSGKLNVPTFFKDGELSPEKIKVSLRRDSVCFNLIAFILCDKSPLQLICPFI